MDYDNCENLGSEQIRGLQELMARVSTFQKVLIYNRSIVDPYLLASFGLICAKENHHLDSTHHKMDSAVCSNPHCSLMLQFDEVQSDPLSKNDIQIEIRDHDPECIFAKVKENQINLSLFQQLGKIFYQQNLAKIQKSLRFVQLSPIEVKQILGFKQEFGDGGLLLTMFKQLDWNLQGGSLIKVKSSVFLAIFGWQYSPNNENELVCMFCSAKQNVFEYISPSQCTLMSVPRGFEFIASHRSWCCLVQPKCRFWKQILRQAVIKQFQPLEGRVNKSNEQIHCKQISDQAIIIYTQHYSRLSNLRKKLGEVRQEIHSRHRMSEIQQSFNESLDKLEVHLEEGREHVERFIKRIKLQ